MTHHLHPLAGAAALATILSFWTGTVLSELFAGPETIALVKQAVLWGFLILIPAMVTAAVTGKRMGRGTHPLARAKGRRMPVIALNGVVVLMPAAVYLSYSASAGVFDTTFVVVQAIELAAGAVNAALLFLNLRDGRRLMAAGYTKATLLT